jgi:hypothetical protein
MGGQIINFAFSRTGLEVWAVQPEQALETPEKTQP